MFSSKQAQQPNVIAVEGGSLRWTGTKVLISVLLFLISAMCILAGITPIVEGFYDLKSFANLIFVVFHGFYMFSFSAVTKSSQFFFWALSFLMLDAMTFIFIYYDEIFF